MYTLLKIYESEITTLIYSINLTISRNIFPFLISTFFKTVLDLNAPETCFKLQSITHMKCNLIKHLI